MSNLSGRFTQVLLYMRWMSWIGGHGICIQKILTCIITWSISIDGALQDQFHKNRLNEMSTKNSLLVESSQDDFNINVYANTYLNSLVHYQIKRKPNFDNRQTQTCKKRPINYPNMTFFAEIPPLQISRKLRKLDIWREALSHRNACAI